MNNLHCGNKKKELPFFDFTIKDYWDGKNIYMKMEDWSANEPDVILPSYALPGTWTIARWLFSNQVAGLQFPAKGTCLKSLSPPLVQLPGI